MNQVIVVGVTSDVATINPLYAFDIQEGHLIDLLFLKPAIEIWNDSIGIIEFSPMIAENWIMNKDSNCITLNLKDNLYWSDGKLITADDIIFSFDIYSDPKVNSRLFGMFENFYSSNDLHIDIEKTFRKNSDKSLTIFFKDFSNFSLLDINHAILPKHLYDGIKRDEVETAELNFKPITSGPFKLYKWERDQKIHLKADSSCYLFDPENIQEIIFKIIPDEFSMITQLKKGEIDLIEDVKTEKVKELSSEPNINIGSIKGRNYDYLGWNHIDPKSLAKKQNIPNKYFGSAKTRKALSLAINRVEIFQSIVGKFGEIYDSPISPIFKIYFDSTLANVEYNPAKAKQLLSEDGWIDSDNDGVLDKNRQKFSFEIYSNTGNPTREFAATIIKNNLKEIGIDAEIIFIEKNELVDGLISKKYDSWISGWSIEIPLNLESYWSSDPEKNMLNFSSFTNSELEEIFDKVKTTKDFEDNRLYYKKILTIFKENEPVTNLFWSNNIIAYNNRIKNINFSPLGLFIKAWDWKIE
jgi:peptide/nickel transport system substrate-binding protein